MYWELWSIRSSNLVETFDTEDEALQGVRELLAVNRPDYVQDLSLGANYDEGESHQIPLPPALSGEELRARLAETAPEASAREATRVVHDKIRRWLAEEGWQVQDIEDSQSSFNVMVTLKTQQQVNIFQYEEHLDHVTVALNIIFQDTGPTSSFGLSSVARRDALRSIERDATVLGLEFRSFGAGPLHILFSTAIYFDGLSKHALIEKILLIHRAIALARLTIVQHAEAAGLSPENAEQVVRRDNVREFPAQRAAAG